MALPRMNPPASVPRPSVVRLPMAVVAPTSRHSIACASPGADPRSMYDSETQHYESQEAHTSGDAGDRPPRARDFEDTDFRGTGSYILFVCIIPVVLGFLGLALIFFVSRIRDENATKVDAPRPFLICRMRSQDLWADTVSAATKFCSHLILTVSGEEQERERSQGEFFKGALSKSRVYLTHEAADCRRTRAADLEMRIESLGLTGFEFYLEGNESSITTKACFDLIDQLVQSKGPNAVILRSGPFGIQLKANVLANVYQTHAPVGSTGLMRDTMFVNNYNNSSARTGENAPLRMVQLLESVLRVQSALVTAGDPAVTNLCYSLSFMGLRLDTRQVIEYSALCKAMEACPADPRPQKNPESRSLLVHVCDRRGNKFSYSYDDNATLSDKARAIAELTNGALCVAAHEVQADDLRGRCGSVAPLLATMAELARSHNSALFPVDRAIRVSSGADMGRSPLFWSTDRVPTVVDFRLSQPKKRVA